MLRLNKLTDAVLGKKSKINKKEKLKMKEQEKIDALKMNYINHFKGW